VLESRRSYPQVADRARQCDELGRYREDLAPHLLQRAPRRHRPPRQRSSPTALLLAIAHAEMDTIVRLLAEWMRANQHHRTDPDVVKPFLLKFFLI
jgi:ferric-dicitrate binding protein FerR (iron transport regulator)